MRAHPAVSDAPDRVLATRRRRTRPTVIDVSEWMQTAIVCALDTSRTARDDTNSSVELFRRDRASRDRPHVVARAHRIVFARLILSRSAARTLFTVLSRRATRPRRLSARGRVVYISFHRFPRARASSTASRRRHCPRTDARARMRERTTEGRAIRRETAARDARRPARAATARGGGEKYARAFRRLAR